MPKTPTARGSWLQVRVSKNEKTTIEQAAKAEGLSVSDYIRKLAVFRSRIATSPPDTPAETGPW